MRGEQNGHESKSEWRCVLTIQSFINLYFLKHHIVKCMKWLQTGFRIIQFIDYLHVAAKNNYNSIADFHTLQISRAQAKSSPACGAFTRRFLVTASNNVYSSSSVLKSFSAAAPFQLLLLQSQSQSYFTTGGLPPISSSWRQAPWEPRQVTLFSNWTLAVIVLT
jgi:hypothetical protein